MTKLRMEFTPEETSALQRRIRDGSAVDANGCWIWQRSTRNGYGQISVRDTNTYTHQLSFAVFKGPIPDGQRVLHTCDVQRCNNPEHLFAGTQLDNVRDMEQKGRARKVGPKGMRHPKARLTPVQVEEVRARSSRGDHQRAIANDLGCSQSTVWRIAHGHTRTEG
ncbi:MAG: to phage protein [Gemmatimonadetes bacterium]|nr:to phage protein [Gemmatimonadota bacterium]